MSHSKKLREKLAKEQAKRLSATNLKRWTPPFVGVEKAIKPTKKKVEPVRKITNNKTRGLKPYRPEQVKKESTATQVVPTFTTEETPKWFTSKFRKCDVSVIVPLFKSSNVIKDQIASWVFDDDGLSKEIIYVDDACPNESYKAVIEAWSNRKDIPPTGIGRIIRSSSNSGFSVTCNTGAGYACGDYLIFLNADCTVTSNWIKPMIDLHKNPEIGIVGNMQLKMGTNLIDSAGSEWCWRTEGFEHIGKRIHNQRELTRPYSLDSIPEELLVPSEKEMVTGCCFSIPRNLFFDLQGFDSEYKIGYWEDTDLNLRVRTDGYKVYFQPESKIYHKGGHSGAGHTYYKHNKQRFFKRWVDSGRLDRLVKDRRSTPPSGTLNKAITGKVVGCMIACNEEEFMEVSVDSIAPVVDEWIIVIGGNEYAYKSGMCDSKGYPNDSSLDIAKKLVSKYGGKVIEPPGRLWQNKVEMRNAYANHLKKNNWMFMLDGDEVYKPNQLWRIAELTKSYECLILQFWLFWNNMNTIGIGNWDNYPQERIVKWKDGYGYRGKNHLNVSDGQGNLVSNVVPTWRNKQERLFYHYSWVRPIEKIKQKQEYYKHQTGKSDNNYLEEVFLKWRETRKVNGTHPFGGGGAMDFPGVHPEGVRNLINAGKLNF